MYAMILEFKPKTIKVLEIDSERISYLTAKQENQKIERNLFASQEGLLIDDILEISDPSVSTSYGKDFISGEYKKLPIQDSTYLKCVKCGNPEKKKSHPLCYSCWGKLHGNEQSISPIHQNSHNDDARERQQNESPSIEKSPPKSVQLSFSDLDVRKKIIVKRAIKNISELDLIELETNKFAHSDVQKGLESLGATLDTVNRIGLDMDRESLHHVDPEYHKSKEIKGLFFEIATHKLIDTMKGREWGIKAVKPYYKKHLVSYEDYFDYEADGEIRFKLARPGFEDVWALYDCKARSNGYNIKEHLEKMMNYLRKKQNDPREKRSFRYFIVISSGFAGDPLYHSAKFSDSDKENMRFILITAKQLLTLDEEQTKRVWHGHNFYEKFPWEGILEADGKSPIYVVEDQKIDALLEIARNKISEEKE